MFTSSPTRRQLLQSTACGFGALALAGLAGRSHADDGVNPLALRQPVLTPRAKRVIFLFMQGGPSQIDTFDYKPILEQQDGKQMAFDDARAVEAAYLSVLTRRPTPPEAEYFQRFLAESKLSRPHRMEGLFWALINSTEFSWNH